MKARTDINQGSYKMKVEYNQRVTDFFLEMIRVVGRNVFSLILHT